jgi:hypothetical protein
MSTTVAKHPDSYCSFLVAPTFKRTRTPNCETNAIATLKDYRRYAQITEDEFKALKKEIKAAPHDDAIANIMCKLRKRVYG